MSSVIFAPNVRNVTRVYRSATDEQKDAGRNWYPDALLIAETIGRAHNVPTRQVAGIIAALSPLNSWGNNVALATRLIAEGGLSRGYLGVGLRKANLILKGAEPAELLLSQKVAAFFQCIVTGGDTTAVCIDRHAFAIAHYSREIHVPSLTVARYQAVADTYRRAATILSREGETVSASDVQATTWVSWRARFWADGAWDVKGE